MARLGHGIDKCLLITRLGHVGSLKSTQVKLKQHENRNNDENENMIWKKNKKIQTKSLIYT